MLRIRLIVFFFLVLCPVSTVRAGYGLAGGNPKAVPPQYHSDELFITLFNSSYKLVTCHYDAACAAYFSRDGINNLFYYPFNKTTSAPLFLRNARALGMNGVVWVPEFWVTQGFDGQDYERWVGFSARHHANLFAWYMPDELPSNLMRPNRRTNPIYDPDNPRLRDPENPSRPWFFNPRNPDAQNTAIGRTRWYAKRIRNADPEAHIIFSPGNGEAMSDLERWVTTLEHLSPYCDVWIRGAYPTWVGRPRTMLLYEYGQWVECRERVKDRGVDVNDIYFLLLLESFKVPASNPVNFIPPEIIRFDAYASLTLGSQGLMWWEGKNWNNPDANAQAMYSAIRGVAGEINVPQGVHLAPCLLADEPKQTVTAQVLKGPARTGLYRGRSYDTIQVRLKQQGDKGPLYLFVANFSEKWDKRPFQSKGGAVKARFAGFPSNCGLKAEVVVDSRSPASVSRVITVEDGAFTDEFEELTARVYRITD
ncbi:MAG: hypothetical protein JW720_06575 [Sedimentisphaerales bacterium]|nr:hypothetical protein [Sedimentisphaerales bacterium]